MSLADVSPVRHCDGHKYNRSMTVLYWLYDPATCSDPYQHGWIGITENLNQRVMQHRCKPAPKMRWLGIDVTKGEAKILLERPRSECLALEAKYRPDTDIGWNRERGGCNSVTVEPPYPPLSFTRRAPA